GLECPGALEHEASRPARKSSDDLLETDERGGAVAPVHHEVLDLPLALDVPRERLGHPGPGELRHVRTLAVGLLLPRLNAEACVRAVLHLATSFPRDGTACLRVLRDPVIGAVA